MDLNELLVQLGRPNCTEFELDIITIIGTPDYNVCFRFLI